MFYTYLSWHYLYIRTHCKNARTKILMSLSYSKCLGVSDPFRWSTPSMPGSVKDIKQYIPFLRTLFNFFALLTEFTPPNTIHNPLRHLSGPTLCHSFHLCLAYRYSSSLFFTSPPPSSHLSAISNNSFLPLLPALPPTPVTLCH